MSKQKLRKVVASMYWDLKNDYEQISNQFEDILFFAFNIDDHEDIDNILPINGVPSVCLINTGAHKNIVTLEDPESPNEETWFERQYIENFIDREKR